MTREETASILEHMKTIWPEVNPKLSEGSRGTGAVLHFLTHQTEPVPAVRISEATGVSTARTAVLLKKLEEKGVIVRSPDPGDARKCMISLSEEGREKALEQRERFLDFATRVINDMGEDRFRELIRLSGELHAAVVRNSGGGHDGTGECGTGEG